MEVYIIAARLAEAHREILEHFEQHAAFSPARAVRCDPPSRIHEQQLDSLIGRAIVKQTANGRYWLDREAFALEGEQQAAAARKVWIVIAIATILAVAAVVIVGS